MLHDCTALAKMRSIFSLSLFERVWLVGGSVRDHLLGRESTDLDLVASISAEELVARGFRCVEPKSTVPIFLRHFDGLGRIEVTRITASSELENDLRRRDFTINAIAATLHGQIIDPLGGQAALADCTLIPCAPTALADDPGRLFRAGRFAADGWRLSAALGEQIASRDWNPLLADLPVERFSREMVKALAAKEPQAFFDLMQRHNFGRSHLPELFVMPQVPAGPPEHHPEGDLYTHSCQVLAAMTAATSDALPRFCAFFHDLGKLATDPALYPKHHGHDDAGYRLAPAFCDRLALPGAWRQALAWSSRLHGLGNRWEEARDSTRIEIAEGALKGGIDSFFPQLVAADWPEGPGMPDWPHALAAARLSATELGLDSESFSGRSAAEIGSMIRQRRVEELRRRRQSSEA